MLLHGIPTNQYLWRNVIVGLSASSIGWITFDLLGYGKSSKPLEADLGVRAQAEYLATAVALHDARLTVVDHAGHFLPEDTPDFLSRLLIDFVSEER